MVVYSISTRIFFALAMLVGAGALAAASSADVFSTVHAAIDAGAYPVALLWLAAPPLMALRWAYGASLPPMHDAPVLLFALVAPAPSPSLDSTAK